MRMLHVGSKRINGRRVVFAPLCTGCSATLDNPAALAVARLCGNAFSVFVFAAKTAEGGGVCRSEHASLGPAERDEGQGSERPPSNQSTAPAPPALSAPSKAEVQMWNLGLLAREQIRPGASPGPLSLVTCSVRH